jgi:hypothetical protein
MKKNIKELEIVDTDELIEKIEQEANDIETNFLNLYSEFSYFLGSAPVFDFEIN